MSCETLKIGGGKTDKKRLLIIGIDPGTTSSYAALDTEGKIVRIRSAKELDLKTIIAEVTEQGTPLAVGTDRKNCPAIIQQFSAKTGARIITPEEDLAVHEKIQLTKGAECRNSHEKDALASAITAMKELEPLLKKIGRTLEKRQKTGLKPEVTSLVVKSGISISSALEILAREDRKEAGQPARTTAETAEQRSPDTEKLMQQVKQLEREKRILRINNLKLIKALNRAKAKYRRLANSSKENKEDKTESFRQSAIASLNDKIMKMERAIHETGEEALAAHSILANLNGKAVMKKLDNLGWEEYRAKNRMLNIREGDTILVNNPNEFSERTLNEIKGKMLLICCKQPASRELMQIPGLLLIDASRFSIIQNRLFAAADKTEIDIERARAGENILASIISEYRAERLKQ
ncbi:DUF460 domain-containing protein [Candidatus Woesearchaeota archaeon]|nr:DUF460 domain-containing protein [Candidatus Woesearchaeota archaeon]